MAGPLAEIRALFCAALDRATPQEQSTFLDQACAGRPEVRARVEALMLANADAGEFLQEATHVEDSVEVRIAEGPGTVIGPYKLLEQIGEGGFGLVFLAEQQQPMRRQVAFKVLKPGMDSRQISARFEAERQALALMNHPNIAKVLDAGETGSGRPYFVMELFRGLAITDYCDQHQLSLCARLELFTVVSHAVQHAHLKGIIHRDLKPTNVLVAQHDGVPVVKVIDFGIAKALGQQLTDKTVTTGIAQLIGTPLYMSPEQADLAGQDIDTRTDIYSLGVLLYELLTGTTPFDKERLRSASYDEMRRIIREEEPPRPSTRVSTQSHRATTASTPRQSDPRRLSRLFRGELDWIVMKALEKDRTRRYETASAFAADVQRYLHDEPVTACPPSAWYLFRKFARRRRTALTMAGVVAAALILMAGSVGWVASDRGARAAIVTERDLAVKSKEFAEEAELRARRAERENELRAHLRQATALRLTPEPGHRARSLAEIRAAMALDPSPSLRQELRNEAIACLAIALDLNVTNQSQEWLPDTSHYDFDDKLELFARSDHRGNVRVHRLSDHAEIGRIAGTGRETWLRFSRDGRFLLGHTQELTKVWAVQAERLELIFQDKISTFDFHPSKPLLAIGRQADSFQVFDLTKKQATTYQVGSGVYALSWHPRANRMAVAYSKVVKVYDLDSEQWLAERNIEVAFGNTSLAWHPEGRLLAMACKDWNVQLWDTEAGKTSSVYALEKTVGRGISLAFNHRGDLLATTEWSGLMRLWEPHTGKLVRNVECGHFEVPRFSPDDRLLAASATESSLQIWELVAGGELRTFVLDAARGRLYKKGAIGVDGRLLAASMDDGVGIWDLKTAAFLTKLPIGYTDGVAFDNISSPPALLLNCAKGVMRWPVQLEPASGQLRLGPPQTLAVAGRISTLAVSRDGRIVALTIGNGGRALWQETGKVVSLVPHSDARHVAISPDSRWIATGSHGGAGARIWDADSGQLVSELWPQSPVHHLSFSSDGQWFATKYRSCQLWKTGSWEKAHQFSGSQFSFAPDGKMLAVETGQGVVCLLDPASGLEIARLENPLHYKANAIFFSPNGSFLVTFGWDESSTIHVWDLRKIRRQLKELNLDWDSPPYPPAAPSWSEDKLQLQVELGLFSSTPR